MSKKGKEYKLAIRIAGEIDKSFSKSLKTADTQMKATFKNMDEACKVLDKGYSGIMNMGTAAFKAVSTLSIAAAGAVTTATVAAVNAGREFETAFTGVRKTIEATAEEYEVLRQDILDMSEIIPSSAVEIAGVMEAAGQLGIAKEDLSEFTETMINLGVSTNMSAEEAAVSLAKFANITGMNPENYEKLGSVIVDLGNKFATTEADIVEMATRLAATGELTGLTETQIMALSTAMSSVGIEAEVGGSTMSKLLRKIQTAVETGSGSLNDYAAVAGMTGQEFATVFEENAVEALSSFIDGLDDVERNGKSAIVILDEMGLKEVRLSNTMLSLANASDVMTRAVETADKAWIENTALAVEAGKRYETTDSKLQILKNSFFNLGVAAYDELEVPFKGVLDNITKGVQNFTDYASGPTGLSSWLDTIATEIPTVQRKVKTFSKNIEGFLTPLLNAGKWLVKNPEYLSSGFVALGSALATYKIVSTVSRVVTAFTSLASPPIALGIASVVGAVGLLAGAVHNVNAKTNKLIESRLDEAFGDIALSLGDIQKISSFIVDNGTLDGLHQAMAAFEDLETIQVNIDDAVKVLDKMNWKVSIGMELTENEQSEYMSSIDSFVSECQEYVTQQNYSVSLALGVLKGDDFTSGVHSNMIGQINQFYTDYYNEFVTLGTELRETVNEAFSDGLFDFDEMEEVAQLQTQLSNMQSKLADAEYEAGLMSLGRKYDLSSLDAESYKNLEAEIASLNEVATEQYATARDKALSNAVLMKNEGELSPAEYEAHIAEIWQDYETRVAEKNALSASWVLSGITENESLMEDLEKRRFELNKYARQALAESMASDKISSWEDAPGLMWHDLYADAPSDKEADITEAAVKRLLEYMQPMINEVFEAEEYYKSNGIEMPDIVKETTATVRAVTAISDKEAVLDSAFADLISDNEEYSAVMDILKERAKYYGYEAGYFIPEGIIEGMSDNFDIVTNKVGELLNNYKKPLSSVKSDAGTANNRFNIPVAAHADGGIFNTPHFGLLAEAGYPEAYIPIDGSKNAISLWERTGQLLGMGSVLDDLELGSSNTSNIEYKPTLIFNGGTPTKSDLESAMTMSQERFEEMMNRYLRDKARLAF